MIVWNLKTNQEVRSLVYVADYFTPEAFTRTGFEILSSQTKKDGSGSV
jgi:hypothetical protein